MLAMMILILAAAAKSSIQEIPHSSLWCGFVDAVVVLS